MTAPGLLRDDLETEGRILYTVKVTSWIVIAISLLWCVASVYFKVFVIGTIAGFVLLGTSATLLLVLRGNHLLGRLLWYVCGVAAVTAAYFVVHPEAHVEAMYVALLGGPFLTFSLYRERVYLLILVPGVFAAWAAVRDMGHDYFGPPAIGVEMARSFVGTFVLATTFVVVTVEMAMFAFLMHRYNERLRTSRRAANVANRAKSEFLAAMSHEIRTPMNGVVGMVEILENSDLTSDQRRILQTIQDSSSSLLRIIEDILDMSKIEAGKLELVNEHADLRNIVEGAVDTLRSYADSNHVYLSLHYDHSLPEKILCDPGRLRQVILNLLGNAIKFSRRGEDEAQGHVRMTVKRDENNLIRFIFLDDGIGIDEEFQRQLFQPFSQSEAVTNRRYGGSGLGLAIVHQLVTKMNGIVSVSSTFGEGAEFTVCLPMVEAEGVAKVPDCDDTAFVVFGAAEWQKGVWHDYLTSCGGVMIDAQTREVLWERARSMADKTVFILAMNRLNPAETEAMITQFRSDFPHRRLLVLTRQRGETIGQLRDNMILVQAGPLLPSDLWAALQSLVGQPSALDGAARLGRKAPQGRPHSSDTRILVAEDNEINQIVIRRQIEQLGYDVTIVPNGRVAAKEWMNGAFDIILTDCHMPDMDGFALTRHVRETELTNHMKRTPIIAITANALGGEAERCLNVGMDGYLSKPFKLAELEELIERFTAEDRAA